MVEITENQIKHTSGKLLISHKNCMDGLGSAYIVKQKLQDSDVIFVQYNEEQLIFDYIENHIDSNNLTIYFTDFSLKREQMIELSKLVKQIYVYDHHKTAEQELNNLNVDNIKVYFDMNLSGVGICLEHFGDITNSYNDILLYLQDRDLWKWELPHSQEINEALRFLVKQNDLDSFHQVITNNNLQDLLKTGEILIQSNENYTNSQLKYVQDIQVQGIDFKAVISTTLISELGNKICINYEQPSLLYFITRDKVVCSLRSTNNLPDVSVIAKHFGGGGHRNACGFTIELHQLIDLLSGRL